MCGILDSFPHKYVLQFNRLEQTESALKITDLSF